MAKGRNNLLGVGGQRKKLSRGDQGAVQSSNADRKAAVDQKQELLKKMRERALGAEGTETAETAGTAAAETAGGQE